VTGGGGGDGDDVVRVNAAGTEYGGFQNVGDDLYEGSMDGRTGAEDKSMRDRIILIIPRKSHQKKCKWCLRMSEMAFPVWAR